MVAASSALVRLLVAVSIACFALPVISSQANAEVIENLYQGEAIVTGQDNEAERARGIREALLQVLVKVSGDAPLQADRAQLEPILTRAETLVLRLEYEDRQAGRPIRDEQGTRDRSYVLRASFKPAAVLEALTALMRTPWPADRPRVLILFVIEDTIGEYLLTSLSERGYGQREALKSVAKRRGIPVILPSTAEDVSTTRSIEAISANVRDSLDNLRAVHGGDVVLSSVMRLTDNGHWKIAWTLQDGTTAITWRAYDRQYDHAISAGLEHATYWLSSL